LPDDWRAYCRERRPELDPDEVFEDFHDYWIAKPGQGGVKLDWLATWRTWVRKQRAPNVDWQTFAQRAQIHARPGESARDFEQRVRQRMNP